MDSNTDEIKVECVEILSEEDAPSMTADDNDGDGSTVAMHTPLNANADGDASANIFNSLAGDGQGEESSSSFLSPFVFERNEREIVIRFIELVRVCPEIWDLTSAAYREKALRRRSFRKIGEQLGWSYDEVLKKYNNLRTYYTKELIKTRRNPNYVSRWPYFDPLDQYLRKTVHIRQQKHRQQHKWTRLLSNRYTSDKSGNYGGTQLSTGFRVRRQITGSGPNTRSRPNSVLSRLQATDRPTSSMVASTSSSTQSSNLSHTSMPSVASTSSAPLINISHIAAPSVDSSSLRERQRERQVSQVSPAALSRALNLQAQPNPPRQSQVHTQSSQNPLPQPAEIHVHHRFNTQEQRQQGAAASSIQIRNVHSQSKDHPSRSAQPSTSSSTAMPLSTSLAEMENSDTIFGKLIASQLSKIREGRKKEQLKISLMQHIVQAMFDNGDS